jgi:putative intracellular protease/amidase
MTGFPVAVCTGSWLLAATGCLKGEKATTNKIAFNECKVCSSLLTSSLLT